MCPLHSLTRSALLATTGVRPLQCLSVRSLSAAAAAIKIPNLSRMASALLCLPLCPFVECVRQEALSHPSTHLGPGGGGGWAFAAGTFANAPTTRGGAWAFRRLPVFALLLSIPLGRLAFGTPGQVRGGATPRPDPSFTRGARPPPHRSGDLPHPVCRNSPTHPAGPGGPALRARLGHGAQCFGRIQLTQLGTSLKSRTTWTQKPQSRTLTSAAGLVWAGCWTCLR